MSEQYLHKILVAVKENFNKEAFLSAMHPMSGKVHLVFYHVVELPLTSPMYRDLIEPVLDERMKRFEGLVEWAERQGFKASLKVVPARDAASSIIEETYRESYTLIVVQRVKKGLSEKLHLGLSEKLIHSLKLPILILPPLE